MALLQGSAVCHQASQVVLASLDVRRARREQLLPSVSTLFRPTAFGRCAGKCVEDVAGSSRNSGRCFSSGGTRRDWQKLTARTKRRRARHVKGVTPTKQDMLDELGQEVTSDEILAGEDEDFEDDEGVDDTDDYLYDSELDSAREPAVEDKFADQPTSTASKAANGFHTEGPSKEKNDVSAASSREHGASIHNKDSNKHDSDDTKGTAIVAVGSSQDPVGSTALVVRETGAEAGRDIDDSRKQVDAAVEDGRRNVQDQAGRVVSDFGDQAAEVATAAGKVADIGQDTVNESRKELSKAGEAVSRDISEVTSEVGSAAGKVADIGQDTVNESGKELRKAGEAVSRDISEVTSEMGNAAGEAAGIGQNAFQESVQQLNEAGDVVGKNISEVADKGQSFVQEQQDFIGTQAQKGTSQLQEQGDRLVQTTQALLERLSARAQTAAQRVQDSSMSALTETSKAADVLGSELRGIGEVLVDAAGEAVGLSNSSSRTSGKSDETSSPTSSETSEHDSRPANGKLHTADTSRSKEDVEKGKQEEGNSGDASKGLKVLVASDTGRLGRLIVEELITQGTSVSTLAPVASRNLRKLGNVQVIEENVYSYDAAKKALATSDAIICTIGNELFPFDPLKTYQVTYEGVLNLVAAAKNQGNIKKFILVTSLGVTQLQLLPFLFWRKQTELFLQRSGLDYTIIRPGILTGSGSKAEAIELHPADSQLLGFVGDRKVAELCAAAVTSETSDKIIEVVAGRGRSSSRDVTKLLQNFQ